MELGHLLTRSGLTYPEASSKVCIYIYKIELCFDFKRLLYNFIILYTFIACEYQDGLHQGAKHNWSQCTSSYVPNTTERHNLPQCTSSYVPNTTERHNWSQCTSSYVPNTTERHNWSQCTSSYVPNTTECHNPQYCPFMPYRSLSP